MKRPAAAALRFTLFAAVALATACGGTASPTPAASDTPAQGPLPTATLRSSASARANATAATDACATPPGAPPAATVPANSATALAFAPDGRLFWSERAGAIRVWQNGAAQTWAAVATPTTEANGSYSERGLLGLAISPSFAADRFVYAFFSDPNQTEQRVIRFQDCAGKGINPTIIITVPSGNDCCHKGGRIAFGPDGMLYVTLGEEHVASAAQNAGDVRGKILRYRPDGSIPADNPFGAANPVWALGFRNPFGLAFSANGQLAVTSNGPSGDAGSPGTGYDVLYDNVQRGGNYGWPNCYGYAHVLQSSACGNQPAWSSEHSTVVPTGVAFVDGSGPAAYRGHIVFCTYNSGMLILSPGSPHGTVAAGPATCRLAVVEGPDHALYLSDSGGIYRVS